MDPTLDRKKVGAHEILGEEEGIANDYSGIAREITRARERILRPAQGAASSNPQIKTTSSPGPADDIRVREQPAAFNSVMRGFVAAMLFACIIVTAIFWQSSYLAWIRPTIARWTPEQISLSERPRPIEQTSQRGPRIAAGSAPLQTTSVPQIAAEDIASTTAQISPELVQLRDALVRDLANLAQEVELLRSKQEQQDTENARTAEQLKAMEEQLVREAARTDEQLKTTQEELSRLMAKSAERTARPRTAARRQLRRHKP
jgi:hypothetical protein